MKGTVCQLNYYGGGCLRSVHPGPDGSNCEAAWPFATAPLGLKVGDAVTFTLTEGGQAVDLQGAWGMVYPHNFPVDWTIAVASGDGDASAVAGSRNAGLQQKVRKLLIGCLELLDLTDGTTHELVDTALQHIRDLVMVKTLSQNQPSDGDASSSLKRKHKVAEDQWQALAALVGTHPDDASALVRADAVPGEAAKRKVLKGKDRASSAGGHYQPSSKVKKLDSAPGCCLFAHTHTHTAELCQRIETTKLGQRKHPGRRHLEVLGMPSDRDKLLVLGTSHKEKSLCVDARKGPRGLQDEDGEEVPMAPC
eukprot:Skav223654  [mRNA]  locus=scaffold4170:15560:17730:+ [translate_table: standard]